MHSVSQVDVPGPNGPLHLTSQQEVKHHLSEALTLQFQLTANSPFLTDPLCYELGLLDTSLAAQAILQGMYRCLADIDFYTQQLISILQIPPWASPVPSGISLDDFISHWRCFHECTSSSIRVCNYVGCHLSCKFFLQYHLLL